MAGRCWERGLWFVPLLFSQCVFHRVVCLLVTLEQELLRNKQVFLWLLDTGLLCACAVEGEVCFSVHGWSGREGDLYWHLTSLTGGLAYSPWGSRWERNQTTVFSCFNLMACLDFIFSANCSYSSWACGVIGTFEGGRGFWSQPTQVSVCHIIALWPWASDFSEFRFPYL